MPLWMQRHWEASETTRLNEAHWAYATSSDRSINEWIQDQLADVRARVNYEARQNGDIAGMIGTLADDVVGPDGPTLEVQSNSTPFNDAVESLWREWFAAPTFRRNVSGAQLLRLWVQGLPKSGEFLAEIDTDRLATGPVKMRLRPKQVRDLQSPVDATGAPRIKMGVEFETVDLDRPLRYWIGRRADDGFSTLVEPWPADLVIHEFLIEEEEQVRGIPWFTPSLPSAADLRDYDDQIQDAARLMADQACLLYNTNPDEPWATPESTEFERRTIKMVPPGWQPFTQQASQPPVQYPQYRAERLRQIARPVRMPLMIAQADASSHNYSSARFDGQGWARFVAFVQYFLSGTDKSCGVLNRLVDIIIAEARFAYPILRNRPERVAYHWTWPVRPHVDPLKEAAASETRLTTLQSTLTDELAERGVSIDRHIATLVRERQALEEAGLPLPAYMTGGGSTVNVDPDKTDDTTKQQKVGADG